MNHKNKETCKFKSNSNSPEKYFILPGQFDKEIKKHKVSKPANEIKDELYSSWNSKPNK
jgi:hypothetical protein